MQYSIPYCIGVAAIVGVAALLPIENEVLNRPDISEFARKVSLHVDAALDARFPGETLARVLITTANGQFASSVTTPRGEPTNPMSWADLREKFRIATRDVMREEQQQSVLAAVDRLADGKLDPLLRILATPLVRVS